MTKSNTTFKKGRAIDWIVIHYTAGVISKAGSAQNTASYFSKAATKASADYIVDDAEVVQYNDDIANRYTWHCGGSKYDTKGGKYYKVCTNSNSIGIEVCSNNRAGKMTPPNDGNYFFTDSTIVNLVRLVRELMEEYNIHDSHVIRHYDVNGKLCPGIIGWNDDSNNDAWALFKAML